MLNRQVFADRDITIVPVLVGALSTDREGAYGQIFAPYLQDPQNLFVISSDFCHWGKRFSFTFTDGGPGAISSAIERLDKQVESARVCMRTFFSMCICFRFRKRVLR